MTNMKKLALAIVALFVSNLAIAQTIDVQVDPDVKVDIQSVTEAAVHAAFDGWGDHDDTQYQQDTQEVEIPLTKPGERGVLNVDSRNGKITITGYDGATVKVKMIKFSKKVDNSESGSGMRLISSGGFNFQASEYNNEVEVENEGWGNRVDFEIQVPRNFDIIAQSYNNGNIVVKDVEGELDIESYNGPITLENISGAASASTYNGAVKVSFAKVTADVPMTFNTYNGNVDISVPDGTKFSTKMKTNRDIFTDFENFSLSNPKPTTRRSDSRRGFSVKYENWVQGDLNGGGAEVTMKTRNGNIYIRKM